MILCSALLQAILAATLVPRAAVVVTEKFGIPISMLVVTFFN